MSNNIKAVAKVKEHRIIYSYMHDSCVYEIETPKTQANEGVVDGEHVTILLTVMPYEEVKHEDIVVIDDE